MLAERTIGESISAGVRFLLAQKRQVTVGDASALLWREQIPDQYTPHSTSYFAGTMWTTADIIYAFACASKNADKLAPHQTAEINNALSGFFDSAINSIVSLQTKILERSQEEFSTVVHSIANIARRSLLRRAIRVVVKDLQSYAGMPRSLVVHTTNDGNGKSAVHLEWGTANLSVTAVVCRALQAIINSELGTEENRLKAKAYIRKMANVVSNADLSIFRAALRSANSAGDEDAIEELIYDLKAKYDCLVARYAVQYDLPHLLPKMDIVKTHGKYLPDLSRWLELHFKAEKLGENRIGCLWPTENDCGWSDSSQNHVTEPVPTTALPAIEIIAYALQHTTNPGDMFSLAKRGIEAFRAELGDGTTEGFQKLRDSENLSQKWSVEFLARQLVYLVHIQAAFAALKEKPIWQSNGDLKTISDKAYECFECLYAALLVRTFQATVERRTWPFEAIPQEYVAGNELAHAPGVDISFVTYALLFGRERFRAQDAQKKYVQLGKYFSRIVGTGVGGVTHLPPGLPLYKAMIDGTSSRIIGEYEESQIAPCLRQSFDSGEARFVGAFLSSYSEPKDGEYTPKIYTWATAHALMSLVEWVRQHGDEVNCNEQLRDAQKKYADSEARQKVLSQLGARVSEFGVPAIVSKPSGYSHLFNLAALIAADFVLTPFASFNLARTIFHSVAAGTLSMELLVAVALAVGSFLYLHHQFTWLRNSVQSIDTAIAETGLCLTSAPRCGLGGGDRCKYGSDDEQRCAFAKSHADEKLVDYLSWFRRVYLVLLAVAFGAGFPPVLLIEEKIISQFAENIGLEIAVPVFLFVAGKLAYRWMRDVPWFRALRLFASLMTGRNQLYPVISGLVQGKANTVGAGTH